jgi:hypothetical protein
VQEVLNGFGFFGVVPEVGVIGKPTHAAFLCERHHGVTS